MTEPNVSEIWVYLSASPLLGLTITMVAYGIAYRAYTAFKGNPLVHPVVVSVAILISFLLLTNTSYEQYFEGAQFVHFLLGPATVALAVPLYQQFAKVRRLWLPIIMSLFAGTVIASLTSVYIARLFGASLETQLSLAPKSVTAPVAMGVSEKIGGLPALTAVLVVCTGIIGAVFGTRIFALLKIRDDSIKGIAMGVTAHGIGTARAFQVSAEMGAFSGLAMALSTIVTAFFLPWVLSLLGITS